MPCTIGYRNYSTISIPAPQPQKFKSKSKGPEVDKLLMDRLGQEDPEFLSWMLEQDIEPLLSEALRRALAAVDENGVSFSIADNGDLIAEADYTDSRRKKRIQKTVSAVSSRWQMEILKIVAELLDFEAVLKSSGDPGSENWELEGEKHSDCGVHEYIQVTKSVNGDASMRFEHYKSGGSADLDRIKFMALAQKFGVKIRLIKTQSAGQPIPQDTVHRHFLHGKE